MPAGTYIVPLAQPAGRLARNLLDPDVKMDDAFLQEQERRRSLRLPDQIYDVTAWSLPLVFDVDVIASDRASTVPTTDVDSENGGQPPAAAPSRTPLGYLLPWGSAAAAATIEALREGIRVHSADQGFTHGGRRYAAGTAFIRIGPPGPAAAGSTGPNAAELATKVREIASRHGAEIVPIDQTWTDEGISLGSGRVATLQSPRVLMAWDSPTSSLSAGWARYVLERRFGQRVTAMRVSTLQNFNMHDYDVLVLPSGSYSFNEDALRRLRDWIRSGGTLITLAEASRWAARDRNNLLATDTLLRDGTPERDSSESSEESGNERPGAAKPDPEKPFDYEKAITPDRERPESLAGALLRVRIDRNHWLTAGLDDEIQVVVEGSRVFAPLKLDDGRNIGVYQPVDRLVASGLVWKEAQPLLAQRSYLMHQSMGRGHIVAFAEDPNYRAFAETTELLFINAVLLAPGH